MVEQWDRSFPNWEVESGTGEQDLMVAVYDMYGERKEEYNDKIIISNWGPTYSQRKKKRRPDDRDIIQDHFNQILSIIYP